MPSRAHHGRLIAAIILAGFFSYVGLLDTYFIKDDLSIQILTGGGHEFHFESWFRQVVWPTERKLDDIFRPVPSLTWAPEYLLFGPDPIAFHLGNVLLHCLNGVLLYWLVNRLLRFSDCMAGFWAGMLFVLYPLHGEAVLWCTQRFVVMGLLFYLLTLIAFDAWLHRGKTRLLFLALVSMAFATLSKELGITLPGVMGVWALVAGPTRSFSKRVKEMLVIGVLGALWLGLYFGMRIQIFGRPLGEGYAGWPTMEAYAVANRVFERLPTTLLAWVTPINRSLAEPAYVLGFVLVQGLFSGLALLSLPLASRRRGVIPLCVLTILFAALAYFPTMYICYIDSDLLNSRFGYHVAALPLAVLPVLLLMGLGRRFPVLRWVPALVALTYVFVLQRNLTAYHEGGAQVRQLQVAVADAAREAPSGTGIVVFDVPSAWNGCPTVDAYLPALLSPPLLSSPVPAIACVPGTDWTKIQSDGRLVWPTEKVVPKDVLFFTVVKPYPVVLRPLFGEFETAAGQEVPDLLEPNDAAILIAPGDEPVFRFTAPPERRRFRLHVAYGREASNHLTYGIEIGKNADEAGGVVTYRLSAGDLDGKFPDPWLLLEGPLFVPPTPVLWRIETLSPAGVTTGVSAERRLVVLKRKG